MSTAKITLIGLNFYSDGHIFDKLRLPDGINKDVLTNAILLNSGEFEPLYADYEAMRFAIGVWSEKWYDVFLKWKKALNHEYNPFYNYDLHSESEDNRDINTTTDTTSNTESENHRTIEDKVSAFDSDTYQPSEKTQTDGTEKKDSTGKIKGKTDDDITRRSHVYGIRPTMRSHSMSELLQEELDVSEWNLYEHIADIFAEELLIMVY